MPVANGSTHASPGCNYASSKLCTALDRYCKRNPISRSIHDEACQWMPGGNTRTTLHMQPFPMNFKSGCGAELTSADGDVYLDFLGDYSAGLFGHSNSPIKGAITQALDNGWAFGGQNVYERTLARNVIDRFSPAGLEMVRFTNSGTEANTMAIATALVVTGRSKVLVFTGAYHGGTLTFPKELALSTSMATVNLPHEFVIAPYNNIDECEHIISRMPPSSLAAILVEPLQGSGGCRPSSLDFLPYLRTKATELGAVLICDEVMTSRLSYNGYCASLGVKADLVTLGKYLAGGMSFGAFGGRPDLMRLFDPSTGKLQHAGTFNNNIATMAAGIAAMDIFTPTESSRLNALGLVMKINLQTILIEHGLYSNLGHGVKPSCNIVEVDSLHGPTVVRVFDASGNETEPDSSSKQPPRMYVTGQGSMLNVRFSGDDRLDWLGLFHHHMLAENIYLAARGYMALNLALSTADVEKFTQAFAAFVLEHIEHLRK